MMSRSLAVSRARRVAIAAYLLAVAAPSTVHAQRLADLPAGTRLRVATYDVIRWREGTLDTLTTDSLAVQRPNQRLVIPRAQLVAVERRGVDASRRQRALKGELIGALAGLAADVALVVVCQGQNYPEDDCTLVGALFAGPAVLLGGAVGAGINAARPLQTWEPVQLP